MTDREQAWNATTNPYEWETKIEVLRCPSYAGEESVAQKADVFFSTDCGANTGSTIASGNYIALPSTHYLESMAIGAGDLAADRRRPAQTRMPGAQTKAYCGNGALPFPGTSGTPPRHDVRVTKQGLGFAQISDGTVEDGDGDRDP